MAADPMLSFESMLDIARVQGLIDEVTSDAGHLILRKGRVRYHVTESHAWAFLTVLLEGFRRSSSAPLDAPLPSAPVES